MQGGCPSFALGRVNVHLSSSAPVLVASPCRRFRQHPVLEHSSVSNSSSNSSNATLGGGQHPLLCGSWCRHRRIRASDQPDSSANLSPQASLRSTPLGQDQDPLLPVTTTFGFTGPTPAPNGEQSKSSRHAFTNTKNPNSSSVSSTGSSSSPPGAASDGKHGPGNGSSSASSFLATDGHERSSTAHSPTSPPPSPLPHHHGPPQQPLLSPPSIPLPLHHKVEETNPPAATTLTSSVPHIPSPYTTSNQSPPDSSHAATQPPHPPEPPNPSPHTPSSFHAPEYPHQGDQPQDVDAAMARAQESLSQLESSLDAIPHLHSANISSSELPMPPMRRSSPWMRALSIARNVALIGGGGVALIASHAFGLAVQLLSAVAGAMAIAYLGHRRGSLSASGAVVAFMVGVGTLCCSLRFAATLLAFFFASSKLTHFKEEVKAKMDDNAKSGGQRDWKQVLCNGLVPTCLAVAYGLVAGCVDVPLGPSAQLELWRAKVLTLLGGAYLGWYACCCGDTWASEVGPLSSATPRLITSMRPVRRGTNGGVTMLGLAASVAGGTFTGLVFYLAGLVSPTLWIFEAQRATAAVQWQLIPLGMLAGLVGSLVDSLLGATVQFSGFNHETNRVTSKPGPNVTRITGVSVLDNNLVNVVSAAIAAALTACAAFWLFGV